MGKLGRASRNLGVSQRELNGLANAAAKAGVSMDEAVSGVQSLTLNMSKAKYGIDGVRDSLEEIGLGQLYNDLKRIEDPLKQTARILQFKDSIQGPDALLKKTELLERTGLGLKYLNITAAEYERSQKRSWELTARQNENLKEFHDSLVDFKGLYDQVTKSMLAEVAPFFTTHMQDLIVFTDKIKELVTWTDKLREVLRR